MAIEIVGLTCPPGVYTLFSDGKTGLVSVSLRGSTGGRVAVGATQPAANTPDYYSVRPSGLAPAGLLLTAGQGLTSTDKFWLMPDTTAPVTVEVVRG